MVDISINTVLRIRVSDIEEYDEDDLDDDDEERFHRTVTIETTSGVIELDLNAASEEALDLMEGDED